VLHGVGWGQLSVGWLIGRLYS